MGWISPRPNVHPILVAYKHAKTCLVGLLHAHEVHAREVHAYEGFCEDLARQNTVARLFQLQVGFRRCRIWVSVIVVVS
jgi:hypothetical protein